MIDSTRDDFLERISCRLILLPSGTELPVPFRTPPGAMAYGKLLYGGVKRYRMIGSTQKTTGGGTEHGLTMNQLLKSWLQYGGPERNFEAIDIGSCALVELILTPTGLSLPLLSDDREEAMSICNLGWNSITMFDYALQQLNEARSTRSSDQKVLRTSKDLFEIGQSHVDAMQTTFTSSVGGLQPQIQSIVRRVLDGRAIRSASDFGSNIGGQGPGPGGTGVGRAWTQASPGIALVWTTWLWQGKHQETHMYLPTTHLIALFCRLLSLVRYHHVSRPAHQRLSPHQNSWTVGWAGVKSWSVSSFRMPNLSWLSAMVTHHSLLFTWW